MAENPKSRWSSDERKQHLMALIRWSGEGGQGPDIDFEEILGGNEAEEPPQPTAGAD